MSQDYSSQPIYTARPVEEDDRAMHPLEEVLRLIGRNAPQPFFPGEFLERRRAVNPDQLSAILDHLALERLIDKVPARSLETGSGVVLTRLGEQVLADPAMLARLVRGDALREDDVGAIIRKGMRTRVRPTLTYVLIAINVGVYVLGMANPAWSPVPRPGVEFSKWAGNADAITAGEWWRLITCTFLHASLIHLGSNMFSLYMLGSFVEQQWGRWRFLVIYLVAGWAGSCLGVQYVPSGVPLVGASGAICGLLAAIGAWFLLYRKHIPKDVASRGLWSVAINVGMIAFIGYLIPYVSNAGHLGGGIGGLAAALVLHVQRFGLPGMPRKAAALRWALAVPLLLILPVASYLQMQHARADRGVAKNDDKPDKEVVKKGEKLNKEEGTAFYKEFNVGLGTDVFQAHAHLFNMPDKSNEAQVKKKLARIAADREKLTGLRAKLEQARYDNGPVERMRKQGLSFVDRMLEILDLADEYLKGPANVSSTKLDERYDAFADPFNDYVAKLKQLAPAKGGD